MSLALDKEWIENRLAALQLIMKAIHLCFALMAVIGGLQMLLAVHPHGWMFGIPMLAVGLTYLWYRRVFRGLK